MNGDAMDQEIIDALAYCAHWSDYGEKCLGCERHGTDCDAKGYEKIPITLLEDALALLQRRADAYNEARAAWELARKISVSVIDGGFSHTEMDEVFGIESEGVYATGMKADYVVPEDPFAKYRIKPEDDMGMLADNDISNIKE